MEFSSLNLSPEVLQALNLMGFEEATPIQEQALPVGLAGRDVIGQAQTGTGKTAAFGIPLVEKTDPALEYVQGLVVTPTRELAMQVAEELNKLGAIKRVHALPIYGGQDIERQIKALRKRPHIVVGTPGRLMDHMRRRTMRLNHVGTVVLDEADEMLNMGFIEDIEFILGQVPQDRQTMLFSATMPRVILDIAERFMRDPVTVSVRSRELTVPNTEQYYIEVQEDKKFDVLCRLLDLESPEQAIVFGRTKRRVGELSDALDKRGYSAEGLHGDLTQAQRDSVMRRFREGTVEVLVATDVAARGLDITGITHVYNFDIPQDPEWYVHRIGRTGRLGRPGQAITFVTPRELDHLRAIEHVTKRRIVRRPIPTITEAIKGQESATVTRLLELAGSADIEVYRGLAKDLLEETDSVALLAAALRMLIREPSSEQVRLTEEAPVSVRRARRLAEPRGAAGGQRRSARPASDRRRPRPGRS